MNKLSTLLLLVVSVGASAQKFNIKNNDAPIDKKLENKLRAVKQYCAEDCKYFIKMFFAGSYSLSKGYKGYYIILDENETEIYRSNTWKAGGYAGSAENYIVKRIMKDLKKVKKDGKF